MMADSFFFLTNYPFKLCIALPGHMVKKKKVLAFGTWWSFILDPAGKAIDQKCFVVGIFCAID